MYQRIGTRFRPRRLALLVALLALAATATPHAVAQQRQYIDPKLRGSTEDASNYTELDASAEEGDLLRNLRGSTERDVIGNLGGSTEATQSQAAPPVPPPPRATREAAGEPYSVNWSSLEEAWNAYLAQPSAERSARIQELGSSGFRVGNLIPG